nr:5'(3')-deoxyribonucleotidase [Cytophagales bacterium]
MHSIKNNGTGKTSIAVDMDGVLANVYARFLEMHKLDTGEIFSPDYLIGKPEAVAFPHILKHVNSAGFFRSADLIPGCREVMERLNEVYAVFIVSAAMEFPNSLKEKYDWLAEHFPFIHWSQIVLCGSKSLINTDIMIDDHFKNLDFFKGSKTLLFTQPHNAIADPGRHIRVHNWEEIARLLL